VSPARSPAADGDDDVLRGERDEALAHARALEHELGVVRGELRRLQRVLWRRTRRQQRMAALRERLRAFTHR
jgi:hypothetical protein